MKDIWYIARQKFGRLPNKRNWNIFKRYGFVILLIIMLLGLENVMVVTLHIEPRFTVSLLIVLLCSWFAGFGPGILSALLTGGLTYVLLTYSDPIQTKQEYVARLVYLGIFLTEGFFFNILIEYRRRADKQRNEFLSMISHELKNPLTSIKGYAQLISRLAKLLRNNRIEEIANRIDTQVNITTRMINEMLDLTKIETGRFTYHDEEFAMNDLVKEIVADQQVTTQTHKIIFSSRAEAVMYGDRYRIGQVVMNLITNAIKYSQDAKEVFINLQKKKTGILLSVKDFGAGIAEENKGKIFSAFFRANNNPSTKGTGVGLYISSQIVERHKGKLWFESKEGKGSTFYFWLPTRKK